MFGTTVLSTILVFTAPPGTPPNSSARPDEVRVPLPSAPSHVEVTHFDDVRADGSHVWGAAAMYELSTGDIGEAYVEGDDLGNGEAYYAINGEIVAHATVTVGDGAEGPITSSWSPNDSSYSPEVLAELMHRRVVELMINGTMPREFECSPFGKTVLKAVKYAVYGTATAVTAACCGAVTPGCLVCAFSAGGAAAAAGDALDDYCE
jgi:hypothetical protein